MIDQKLHTIVLGRATLKTFGERVKARREKRGLDQSELASMLGISQPALSKIEAGVNDPRFCRIEDFANLLECSKAFLVEGEPDESATA